MNNSESAARDAEIDALVEQGVISYSDAAEIEDPAEDTLRFTDAAGRLAVEMAIQAGDERPEFTGTTQISYEPNDEELMSPDAATWNPEDGNQKNGPHASAWQKSNQDPEQRSINQQGLAKLRASMTDPKQPRQTGNK